MQHPAVTVSNRGGDGVFRPPVPRFGKRGGEDDRPVDGAGHPALAQGRTPELGNGECPADDRSQHGNGGDGAAHFFQHQALLEDAEPQAAMFGGEGDAEQVGVGQGLVDPAVEAGLLLVDLTEEVFGDEVRQDPSGQARNFFLLVGTGEVHVCLLTVGPGACPDRPWR